MPVVELDELWRKYKLTNDRALRNELVLHYQNLLRQVSGRFSAGLPVGVDREDMYSYGVFGLMDAIEKFDPERGIKFETYAPPRIRGAIIDHVRTLDWVPRSVRTRVKELEKARLELELILGREPCDAEMADKLGVSVELLWTMRSQAAVSPVGTLDSEPHDDEEHLSACDTIFDPSANPEDILVAEEIVEIVARAISGMSERSKTIVTLYYIEEMTLAEIGRLMGVTESRVCQLQSKVLQCLHENLAGHGPAMAA